MEIKCTKYCWQHNSYLCCAYCDEYEECEEACRDNPKICEFKSKHICLDCVYYLQASMGCTQYGNKLLCDGVKECRRYVPDGRQIRKYKRGVKRNE